MIEIKQGNCLDLIKNIPNHSVDMILTDPPYNITSMKWDKFVDFEKLWTEYNRVLKPNGIALLFSSGQFTHKLIQTNEKMYKYRLIWKKNVPTGMSSAKYRPMKYYEEICTHSITLLQHFRSISRRRYVATQLDWLTH